MAERGVAVAVESPDIAAAASRENARKGASLRGEKELTEFGLEI